MEMLSVLSSYGVATDHNKPCLFLAEYMWS